MASKKDHIAHSLLYKYDKGVTATAFVKHMGRISWMIGPAITSLENSSIKVRVCNGYKKG